MATNKITYTLDFKANFKDVQGQLTNLKNSLNSVIGMQLNGGHLNSDIKAASNAAAQLKIHLRQALDPKTGKLDLTRLQNQMRITGTSAKSLANDLLRGGHQGAQAYLQLSNAMLNAQKSGIRLNEIASQLWVTLKNTAKWQISSYALTSMTSAFSNALTFAKELDKSLNDIRIVTGDSRAQMERFAVAANKTAKALSTTTKRVADATLIYRQQGDTAEEAAKKAEITIKAANASRAEAQEMSEYLTGIWNSYQVGAENLELFADKLVKVGAVTATSAEELAISMTKVAATANTVGVSYDQLLSTIATVSSATRVSAEQIGTAFKTIYARMGDLELKGSIDEDGVTTTLGTVSSSLKQVGVNVLDAQGNIRDMGLVIEELGTKWQTMTLNEKTAIAEAVASKRQYTQLFALFDNWDEYQRTLKEAGNAQGELNKQQAIYADSIEGAQARLKAAKEDLLLGFMDNETMQDSIDLLAEFTDGVGDLLENMGGLVPIVTTLFGSLILKNAPAISASITNMAASFFSLFSNSNKQMAEFQANWNKTMLTAQNTTAFKENPVLMAELTLLKERSELQLQYMQNQKSLNTIEQEQVKILMEQVEQERLKNIKNQENLKTQSSNSIDKMFNDFTGRNRAKFESMTFDLTGKGLSEAFINNTNNLQVFGKEVDKTQASVYALAKAYANLDDEDQKIIESLVTETGLFKNFSGSIGDLLSQYASYEGYQSRIIEINKESTISIKEIIDSFSLQSKSVKQVEADMSSLINKYKEFQTVEKLKKGLHFNQITNIDDKSWSSYSQIQDKMLSGEKLDSTEIEQALTLLDKMDGKTANATTKIKQLKQAFLNLKGAEKPSKEILEVIKKLRNEAEQLNTKISMTNVVNGFISASTAAMTLGSSLSMLESSWKSMFGEDGKGISLTGMLSLVGSFGMLLTSLKSMGSGLRELNSIYEAHKKKKILLDTADTLSETGNAEATKYNRKETKKFIQVIKEKIGWTNKETASTVADTVAEGANGAVTGTVRNSSKVGTGLTAARTIKGVATKKVGGKVVVGTVAKGGAAAASSGFGAKALAAIGGTVGMYALIAAAIIAATVKIYNTYSTAAVKLKKYKDATEELNKVQEKTNELNDEVNSLEELSDRLEQAEGDKKALLEVSKELNKVIGYVPGLVEGESNAYYTASTRLQAYINLKKKAIEEENKKANDLGKAQYDSITIERTGLDIAETGSIQDTMQEIAQLTQEEMRDFQREGKVGGITYKEYSQTLQKMLEAQNTTFSNIYANDTTGADLENFGEILAKNYISTERSEQFFKDIQRKKLQDAINAYLDTGDKNSLKKMKTAFSEIETKYNDVIGMSDSLRDYRDQVIAIREEEEESVSKINTTSTDTAKSFQNLNEILKSSSALIQDFAKNGRASWSSIDNFAKKLKDMGIDEATREEVQKELLAGNLSEGLSLAYGKLVDKNVPNGVISGDSKEEIDKNYNIALNTLTSQLLDAGIGNPEETAKYLLRAKGAAADLRVENKSITELLDDSNNTLDSISKKYGLIKAELFQILVQNELFKAGNRNLESDLIIFTDTILNPNSGFNISEQNKALLENAKKKARQGEFTAEDQEAYQLLVRQITNENIEAENQRLYTKSKEEREEAEKEYKKSIDKWLKNDALAKVEDRIKQFTDTLEKESRKIKSIDWLEENFGISNYAKKVSSLTTSVKSSLQELDELSQIEIIGADQAEAIENRLSTSYDNFHNYIQELLEATDNLTTKEAEKLTEVIVKQYELITATLEGMNTILEINTKQEGMFSQEKEKNALLRAFGSILNSSTEEEKKANKRKQIEKSLRIDLLEIEQRYQNEINRIAEISTEKGIDERQKDREHEKEQIQKTYDEAMASCSVTLTTFTALTEEETKKMIRHWNNVGSSINAVAEKIKNMPTIGFRSNEINKNNPNAIKSQDNYTVKQEGGSGAYRNDLVYNSKGDALDIYTPENISGKIAKIGESEHGHYVDITDENGNTYTIARMDQIDSSLQEGQTISSGTRIGSSKSWRIRDTKHHDKDVDWTKDELQSLEAYSEDPYDFDDFIFCGQTTPPLGKDGIVNYNAMTKQGNPLVAREDSENIAVIKAPDDGYVQKLGDYYYFKTHDLDNGFRFTVKDYVSIKTGTVAKNDTIVVGKSNIDKKIATTGMAQRYLPREGVIKNYYAEGSDSTPAGEAFLGEKGRELILLPDGKIVLAGQDGMELANLPQGARVLTNEETEEILRNKKDYANLNLLDTSRSGQKIAFERYETGIGSLSNKDFLSDTSKLQEEFYQEELKRQNEQNSAIKRSLDTKNKNIEQDTDEHYDTLKDKTKEMSSALQTIINDTEMELPKVDSKKFLESIEDAISEAYILMAGDEEWLKPVEGKVTSSFGDRIHPVTGKSHFHGGIDIGAGQGTPIFATKSGKVIGSGYGSANGYYIKLDHGDGYQSMYLHMQEQSQLKEGDIVERGDIIGKVGSTGTSTGPHLDFRIYKDGKAIDPAKLVSYARGGLTKDEAALVGEYGREIILYPDGTAGLLGENGMEYAELPAGARIIPNKETERILGNKVDYRIKGYANGTENLTPDQIKTVQTYLKSQGYDMGNYLGLGGIDGVVGSKTNSALEQLFSVADGIESIAEMVEKIVKGEEIERKKEKDNNTEEKTSTFNWDDTIRKEYENQLKSRTQSAPRATEILDFYNSYESRTEEEISAFSDKLSFESIGEASEIHQAGMELINQLWENYIASGEKNIAFESWIGEQVQTLGEKYDEAIAAWEKRVQLQRDAYISDLGFSKSMKSLHGYDTSIIDVSNAYNTLEYDLVHNPKDKDKIIKDYEEIFAAEETYLNAYLQEFNRVQEEKKKLRENEVEQLTALKTLQESYNKEVNSYRDVLYEINKELTASKMTTQWLDKTQKQYLFNEKDYLAVSQKVAEVQKEAKEDWQQTQQAIKGLNSNSTLTAKELISISTQLLKGKSTLVIKELEAQKSSENSLYLAQYINEAYQERAEIRQKELEVLKEELNLQKKQVALNEALMERNVRVFSGGRWHQIANVEKVTKAQQDLADTKHSIETKNLELEQQQQINTDYNEPIRETNKAIAKLDKDMSLAAEKLEEVLRELKGTVSIGNATLGDLYDVFDKRQNKIERTRSSLDVSYGYGEDATQEDIDEHITRQEWLENAILYAKNKYETSLSDIEKEQWHKLAEQLREQLPEDIVKEYASTNDLATAEQMVKGRYGSVLSDTEVYSGFNNAQIANIEDAHNISSYYEYAIYKEKQKVEELLENGETEDNEEIQLAYKKVAQLRKEYLAAGGVESRLGKDMSAEEYKKAMENEYGESQIAKLAEMTTDEFASNMINVLNRYQLLTADSIKFLETVQTEFSSTTNENIRSFLDNVDAWQAKILIKLKEWENISISDNIVVTQANAKGTSDSKSGFSLVNERGIEMISTDYGQIIELNPHQKIFNNDQLNYLYNISREGLSNMDRTVNAISSSMQDNSLLIQHLELKLDNVTDARSFADELQNLTNYIRNTKTIQSRNSR